MPEEKKCGLMHCALASEFVYVKKKLMSQNIHVFHFSLLILGIQTYAVGPKQVIKSYDSSLV